MKHREKRSALLICSLILMTSFTTSCDESFYLSEKEFYALRGQLATQNAANLLFGDLRGETLRITFDNSTSPPRVQSSNLLSIMRGRLTTLALLEGFPFYYLKVDRVSAEVEKQLDNWLADRLRLYAGRNNAQVRLERVDGMRVQFMNNPTFNHSENKIVFNTTLRMTVDCRIKVDALDPITNVLFGGVNGTYDVAIDAEDLRIQGEVSFASSAKDASSMQFRLTPAVGNVVVRDRGAATPNIVKNGVRDVVKSNLAVKVDEYVRLKYDYFALSNCRVSGEFACDYDSRPTTLNPELHAVARGTDNKLYAALRRNEVWSNYTEVCCSPGSPVAATFSADPTLAVSSAGTIELAATTVNGEVFYAQYQNAWKNYRLVAPTIPPGTSFSVARGLRYGGKPAIVATAPGQIEVIVARGNGSLVHLRRLNGNWAAPINLSFPSSVGRRRNITLLAYRDPAAAQAGNRVFLTAVASNNSLYALVFDLETGLWFRHSQLQTTEAIRYAPTVAASGDGQVDLVYVGQSGNLYHRPYYLAGSTLTPGFYWTPETMISSSVNATPMLVASGYRQLGLIARGTDNRLYFNHFVGVHSPTGLVDGRNVAPGWAGWATDDMNGNFIGTQVLSDGQFEEFTATATKTGKIDLVARVRPGAGLPQSGHALHHNGYDAMTYGRKPWKTVHWRGYQKIGIRQFSGRPALAALDRNFEIAFVGLGNAIYDAQNGQDFAALAGLQVLSNPTTVAPSVVSSGKGLVDFIAVGTDQKINHLRYYNARHLLSTKLPAQTNLNFQRRPAVVGYGDGQLDVIAVSTSGSIHYWRYLNGVWQNPQQISGFVISSPILVNTGSGQLEFFAVGGDNKLYRWRFLGGAWGNWQQIPSEFTINPARFGLDSATTWGDGTVDLAVVANSAVVTPLGSAVYHRDVEPRDDTISLPNMPAQRFHIIGVSGGDQPFIAALNKNAKFVIVKDLFNPSFNYYWLDTSGVWQTGRILDNTLLGLQIGGVVKHSNGAAAIAIDANGKIYSHKRLSAERPTFDFTPVAEQDWRSQLRLPRYRPAIASFGGQ